MINREEIIKEIKRISKEENTNSVSRRLFIQKSGISNYQIYNFFDSWEEVINEADLESLSKKKISEENLFQEMLNIFSDEGQIITKMKFEKKCKFDVSVYRKRFGKWENVLIEFKQWLIDKKIEFPLMNDLPNNDKLLIDDTFNKQNTHLNDNQRIWEKSDKKTYGDFISFRGLQHAPVNEQGVVFLFGMIAFELGFVVESVQSGYPDCEAKRRIGKDKWQRIFIEFEYRSSHFKDHGHDVKNCDLIICWENNWNDCPIEVIELKKEILSLDT